MTSISDCSFAVSLSERIVRGVRRLSPPLAAKMRPSTASVFEPHATSVPVSGPFKATHTQFSRESVCRNTRGRPASGVVHVGGQDRRILVAVLLAGRVRWGSGWCIASLLSIDLWYCVVAGSECASLVPHLLPPMGPWSSRVGNIMWVHLRSLLPGVCFLDFKRFWDWSVIAMAWSVQVFLSMQRFDHQIWKPDWIPTARSFELYGGVTVTCRERVLEWRRESVWIRK